MTSRTSECFFNLAYLDGICKTKEIRFINAFLIFARRTRILLKAKALSCYREVIVNLAETLKALLNSPINSRQPQAVAAQRTCKNITRKIGSNFQENNACLIGASVLLKQTAALLQDIKSLFCYRAWLWQKSGT